MASTGREIGNHLVDLRMRCRIYSEESCFRLRSIIYGSDRSFTTRRCCSASQMTVMFSSLPPELRLMVWRESFEPRILHIASEKVNLPGPRFISRTRHGCCHRRSIPNHIRFKSHEKPPLALQVCRESRTLALKHYTPSFHSSTCPLQRAAEVNQTALYFNPELDTVHIAGMTEFCNLSSRTDKETIQSIKWLSMGEQLLQDMKTGYIARKLPAYESLEVLIVVVDGETGSDGDGSSLFGRKWSAVWLRLEIVSSCRGNARNGSCLW